MSLCKQKNVSEVVFKVNFKQKDGFLQKKTYLIGFFQLFSIISYSKWWRTPFWKYCVTVACLSQTMNLICLSSQPEQVIQIIHSLNWIAMDHCQQWNQYILIAFFKPVWLNFESTEVTDLGDTFRHLIFFLDCQECIRKGMPHVKGNAK